MNLLGLLRYKRAVGENRPIRRLEYKQVNSNDYSYYEAMSYLDARLHSDFKEKTDIYGCADGQGADKWLLNACLKSLSESFERWAYYSSLYCKSSGTDIDATSTGFAAHPSSYNSARENSIKEGLERWGIQEWWINKVHTNMIDNFRDIKRLKLNLNYPNVIGLIIWKKTDFNRYVYGYACDSNLDKAFLRARYEMERNSRSLSLFLKNQSTLINMNLYERRLLYFSTEQGHQHFLSKVNQEMKGPQQPPILIFDKQITGEWSQYSYVWRCLFQSSTSTNQDADDYFLF